MPNANQGNHVAVQDANGVVWVQNVMAGYWISSNGSRQDSTELLAKNRPGLVPLISSEQVKQQLGDATQMAEDLEQARREVAGLTVGNARIIERANVLSASLAAVEANRSGLEIALARADEKIREASVRAENQHTRILEYEQQLRDHPDAVENRRLQRELEDLDLRYRRVRLDLDETRVAHSREALAAYLAEHPEQTP